MAVPSFPKPLSTRGALLHECDVHRVRPPQRPPLPAAGLPAPTHRPTYRRLGGLLLLVAPGPQLGEVLQLPALLGGQLRHEARAPPARPAGRVLHVDGHVLQRLVQVKLHLCKRAEPGATLASQRRTEVLDGTGVPPGRASGRLLVTRLSQQRPAQCEALGWGAAGHSPKARETGRSIRLWIVFRLDLGVIWRQNTESTEAGVHLKHAPHTSGPPRTRRVTSWEDGGAPGQPHGEDGPTCVWRGVTSNAFSSVSPPRPPAARPPASVCTLHRPGGRPDAHEVEDGKAVNPSLKTGNTSIRSALARRRWHQRPADDAHLGHRGRLPVWLPFRPPRFPPSRCRA